MKAYKENERKEMETLAKMYRDFLDKGKTERECTENICKIAEKNGYRNLKEILDTGDVLKAGDKVYAVNMKKSVMLMEIGSEPLEKGMLLIGSHIDSPRLDLKQKPLYEKNGMAYLDTHYYGGIKKYQWVASPMALHGTVVKTDGSTVQICVGENPEEPVVGVTDLLVHLSSKQLEKKGSTVVEGEALDLLVGSRPVDGEEEETPVKAYIVKLLKEQYGIEEEDFVSAELEVVPAGRARDFGLDSSMVMAYGQDDRICAFCSLMGFLYSKETEKTKICMFVDKEEIGSVGATGMQSRFFEDSVAELLNLQGSYSELAVRRAMRNSKVLSSDVSAAYDPNYPEVSEKRNAAYFGKGLVFNKYTGSRGKSGSNDANAEYLAKLRRIFEENQVAFQTAELGKVDQGGGGTIAYILANYGMQVIDSGVAVLSMHAPWEIISKVDLYEALSGYEAFLKEA